MGSCNWPTNLRSKTESLQAGPCQLPNILTCITHTSSNFLLFHLSLQKVVFSLKQFDPVWLAKCRVVRDVEGNLFWIWIVNLGVQQRWWAGGGRDSLVPGRESLFNNQPGLDPTIIIARPNQTKKAKPNQIKTAWTRVREWAFSIISPELNPLIIIIPLTMHSRKNQFHWTNQIKYTYEIADLIQIILWTHDWMTKTNQTAVSMSRGCDIRQSHVDDHLEAWMSSGKREKVVQ